MNEQKNEQNLLSKTANRLRLLGITAVGLGMTVLSHAADPATVDEAVTAVNGNIDKVGTSGIKAVAIAAGLALAFTVIGFIRKAKR